MGVELGSGVAAVVMKQIPVAVKGSMADGFGFTGDGRSCHVISIPTRYLLSIVLIESPWYIGCQVCSFINARAALLELVRSL